MNDDIYKSRISFVDAILLLAEQWAYFRSKDPNTKVGAVVYDPLTGGMHFGYNGFPPGFPDLKRLWDNRDPTKADNKYEYVVHAEVNAVTKALQAIGEPLTRCVLYVTHYPCHKCMKDVIIPSGLRSVVYGHEYPPDPYTAKIASACGVKIHQHTAKIV